MLSIPINYSILFLICTYSLQSFAEQNSDKTLQRKCELKYINKKFGDIFPMGNYVFEAGLTISIKQGGHKRSRLEGPYKSWVDVVICYKEKEHEFSLNRSQKNKHSPVIY